MYVFTGDAGLMCRENALVVRGLGKHYVFTVKGNMQRLFPTLQNMFAGSGSPSRVTTTEERSGAVVTRTLHTLTIGDIPDLGIYEAQEVWRLEQRRETNGALKTEVRFFITPLPRRELSPTQKLTLVRLRLGIENNGQLNAGRGLRRRRRPALPVPPQRHRGDVLAPRAGLHPRRRQACIQPEK